MKLCWFFDKSVSIGIIQKLLQLVLIQLEKTGITYENIARQYYPDHCYGRLV